ncbi:MAG: TlpA family protein disulfide reductase [Deltaproteobacteria bacterium]|nr:TlpA family protein disulfide reductase [Deltaproteobacteria bacterium]
MEASRNTTELDRMTGGGARKGMPCGAAVIAMAAALALTAGLMGPPRACATSPEKDGKMVGKASPRFTAVDLDGKTRSFEEVKNGSHAVVVNFWGLRCSACIQEMPYLDDIYRKFAKEGLFVFGVNVDGMDRDAIRKKMKQMSLAPSYCIVEDPDMKLADLFNMRAAPLTYVIDAKGIIRFQHEGFEEGDEKELEKAVDSVLRGKAD